MTSFKHSCFRIRRRYLILITILCLGVLHFLHAFPSDTDFLSKARPRGWMPSGSPGGTGKGQGRGRRTGKRGSGLVDPGVKTRFVGEDQNVIHLTEGVNRGPWVIDNLPSFLEVGQNHTLTLRCLYSDLCPKRYYLLLRGPSILTPPLESMVRVDEKTVEIEVRVEDAGEYQVFAWPDYEECPKWFRTELKYGMNRAQAMNSGVYISVRGAPLEEGLDSCSELERSEVGEGRWVATEAIAKRWQGVGWYESLDKGMEYTYQPYSCKRPHVNIKDVPRLLPSAEHIVFIGDSVMRGAFCTRVWPAFSESGKADGPCTFINDRDLYHINPKHTSYKNPEGREVKLSFVFADDKPRGALEYLTKEGINPTHIITNLGLWLAPLDDTAYTSAVRTFLTTIHERWPAAKVVWRTTTDVAPQIQCFSDKGMTRQRLHSQHSISSTLVPEMREKGMKVGFVDAYEMSRSRPDAGNDGRHWVIESPEEEGWMRPARPGVGDVEGAVGDAIWEEMGRLERV
ncbi:hypothetical protein SAICODRAFT_21050 [Saitoella complicata NRRL Y-17804]|nr:uncharacterized protein SAICODRAFT_21050 [Saitoella complicata NRRL Y-17804]ODQ51015.1 hypothetical protein SAICODRAFT_21050 [Saitoella complicata NRRL Y-17804]